MNVNTGIRFLLVLLLLNPNLIPAQEKGQSSLFFIPLKLAAIDTYIPDSQTDINNILYSLLVQVPGLSVTLLSGEIDTDSFKDEKNVIKYQQACSCLVYGKILEKQNGIYCAVVLKSINFSEIKEEKIEFPYDRAMSKSIEFTFNLSTLYSSWDKSIHLLNSGKIDADILLTHKGGLEKWQEFFRDLENQKGIKGMFLL